MSLLPYVVNELLNDPYDPLSRLYDQHFGAGLLDDDILMYRPSWNTLLGPMRAGYLRPVRPTSLENSGVSSISNQKDQFKVNLDVQQFKPNEINVKVVDDCLVVEGKHEEKQDKHGYISRQFTRRYKLPDNVIHEGVTSTISSDGVLSVTAPKKVDALKAGNERSIPITQTNQPAIKQKKENGHQERMES